jgi:hypothetical protein
MRIRNIFIILACFVSFETSAQDETVQKYQRVREFSPQNQPKFYIDTDIEITDAEFSNILKKHGGVNMIPVFDKYGNASRYYVDTTNTRVMMPGKTSR